MMSGVFSAAPEPKPKSILDPACARAAPVEVRKPNRLKEAFLVPKPPGSLAKKTDTPLGKSFRRKVPLQPQPGAGGPAIRGPPVLASDPRTASADAAAADAPPALSPMHRGSAVSAVSDASLQESVATGSSRSTAASSTGRASGSGSTEPAGLKSKPREQHFPSTSSASTSASTSTSIRFCPLPSTGRTKARAQSISIGVASRSQLLNTQGSAGPHRPVAPQIHRGPPPPLPEDVVDLGEVMQKGVKKIMKRLRKDQTVPTSTTTDGRAAPAPAQTTAQSGTSATAQVQALGRSQSINVAEIGLHPASDVRRAVKDHAAPECAIADDDEDSVEVMSEARPSLALRPSPSPKPPHVWAHPDPFADDAGRRLPAVDDILPHERGYKAGMSASSPAPSPVPWQ